MADGFDKRRLDPALVRNQKTVVTRRWLRLQGLAALGIPIIEYPLPEVLAKIKSRSLGPN